jgi:hypothetical protein
MGMVDNIKCRSINKKNIFNGTTQWAKTLYYVHLIKNIDEFENVF